MTSGNKGGNMKGHMIEGKHNHSTQDDINIFKVQVLLDNMDFLCKHLPEPNRYFGALRTMRIFDGNDEAIIKHEITKEDRVRKFVELLMQRGGKAYDSLCEELCCGSCKLDIEISIVKKLNEQLEEYIVKSMRPAPSTCMLSNDAATSKNLPKPGDPGAPALPFNHNRRNKVPIENDDQTLSYSPSHSFA